MPWIVPTQQNVLDGWNDAENSKFTTLLASTGNPLPDIMARTTEEIRGALRIAFTLDAAGTIDSSTLSTWVAIVRYRIVARLNADGLNGKSRVKEYEEAMETLALIRRGEWGVSVPVAPVSEATQIPGQPVTGARCLHFGMCPEFGL